MTQPNTLPAWMKDLKARVDEKKSAADVKRTNALRAAYTKQWAKRKKKKQAKHAPRPLDSR